MFNTIDVYIHVYHHCKKLREQLKGGGLFQQVSEQHPEGAVQQVSDLPTWKSDSVHTQSPPRLPLCTVGRRPLPGDWDLKWSRIPSRQTFLLMTYLLGLKELIVQYYETRGAKEAWRAEQCHSLGRWF